jgi:hypothetical protein
VPSTEDLEAIERAVSDRFGQRPQRASVTFLGVEPIGVLRFETAPQLSTYLSLGMSRHPMTGPDQLTVAEDGPRAELLLTVRFAEHDQLWSQLALLAAAPAVEGVVYTDGMTVDLGQPLEPRSKCTGVVLARSDVPDIDTGAGSVTILQLLPATSVELAWCRVRGAAALQERWREAGTDLLDLFRASTALD